MNESKSRQDVSERLLHLAVHAAPSGILVVEEGGGRIVFANEALLKMFGYGEEELLGQTVEVLVPEAQRGLHRQHLKAFGKNPAPREMGAGRDLHGLTKDGKRFPVEIGLQAGETEEGKLVVATLIDITRRKWIEERLRRHEEDLEELVAERTRELHRAQAEKERVMEQLIQAEKMTAIGTMASGIGHEINNPLYTILGMAEAIRDEADINRCHEYSRQIIQYSGEIAEIVKNFSGYVQPSSKHNLQQVDVNERITASITLAKQSLLSDEIEITAKTEPVSRILAKSEEIQQIFFNIIRNGIQAIDGKGLVEIDSRQEGERVIVRIRDSGKGIPDADKGRIFDPFFTTKGPHEGEGLGLYVVQQIVIKYNGVIYMESGSGRGTLFTIEFPAVNYG
ncbi:MAG: ATP-binding protein [Pseudomonadota bacterium]